MSGSQYLLQALCDLGVEPAFRSSRLWAFFDYSYRTRADPDYLAERWRKAGISALCTSPHGTSTDADPEHDEYAETSHRSLRHRHAVLVYTPGSNCRMSAKNSGTTIRNGAKEREHCRTRSSTGAS